MSILYKNSNGDITSLIPDMNNIDDSTVAADTTYSSEKIEGTYPITVTATASPISTANGKPRAITIYGKSEIVDGVIKSAGEGWATVDLGTLTWTYSSTYEIFISSIITDMISQVPEGRKGFCSKYKTIYLTSNLNEMQNGDIVISSSRVDSSSGSMRIAIKDTSYTDATAFKNSLNGVYLAYQLADPTQGNTIAIKTDNGTGIDGTMATFATGTPLYGVSDTVRDVMTWDGSAGTVTKNCAEVDLSQLEWIYLSAYTVFGAVISGIKIATAGQERIEGIISSRYPVTTNYISTAQMDNKSMMKDINSSYLYIKDTDYANVSDFVTALGDAELVYELATPTTEQLTQTENESLSALKTYSPQTAITINDNPEFMVEAYANTANGKAVQELESRIKSEIDEVKNEKSHFCYSYKIDMSDSNPATCVKPHFDTRYGCDNFNFTSAHMDYANDRFDYGSWEGFIRRIARPCMLKYDGTVDYYLDPDDYSKKITGEASDVADVNYQGNAMVELEKLYFKRYTYNGIQYCFIADRKLDKSFKAYAHHDKYGKDLDYIYRACYDGMYDGTRLRSISGIDYHNLDTLTAGYIMSNTTRQEEMNFAKANNVSTEQGEGWNILHKAEWDYINDILVLISMSTDTQGTFGRGRDSGYVSTSDTGIISTGTMNTKGLFWGKNDSTAGVKVLGIENHWANIFKSCAGWMLISNQHYTKMTFGTEDGSTGTGFNTDGTGYLATGASISANGYISDWAENDNGFLPTAASGSASTYRCDYVWQSTATYFALVGGVSYNGLRCGAFFASLDNGAGSRCWDIGAALSYKPLVGGELAA